MTEPGPRRRRPAVACHPCRKRKVRCNRESPCSNCLKAGHQASCLYRDGLARVPQGQQGSWSPEYTFVLEPPTTSTTSSSQSIADTPTTEDSPNFQPRSGTVLGATRTEPLVTPRCLASVLNRPIIETTQTSLGGAFHVHHDPDPNDLPESVGRSAVQRTRVFHKSRVFGQTHWLSLIPLIKDTVEMVEPYLKNAKGLVKDIDECKALARTLKQSRTPEWPCTPSEALPDETLCRSLVDCYLRTSETVYRVLHVPAFLTEFEQLWTPGAKSSPVFRILLKLVLAIGSSQYDQHFSMRASAIRWVYEAQLWLSEPGSKVKLNAVGLQIQLLHLLAREAADVDSESIWTSVGTVLRNAMALGYHHDPPPNSRSTLVVEGQRRLWNTLLEIAVQSSLSSGQPPLMSMAQFTTKPPQNYNDEDLGGPTATPEPRPDTEFTGTTVAILLRKTLPLRLHVVNSLNDGDGNGHIDYDNVLRVDSMLREEFRCVRRQFLGAMNLTGRPGSPPYAVFALEICANYYLSALHVRFLLPSIQPAAAEYAYSRRVVSESCIKIWRAAAAPPPLATQPAGQPSTGQEDIRRAVTCGFGFCRMATWQSLLLLLVELKAQAREMEDSLLPQVVPSDLAQVLQDANPWCLECIRAGQTNVKGYIVISAIGAHIAGLQQGLRPGEELISKVIQAVNKACGEYLDAVQPLVPADGVQDEHWANGVALDDNMLDMNWNLFLVDFLGEEVGGLGWVLND